MAHANHRSGLVRVWLERDPAAKIAIGCFTRFVSVNTTWRMFPNPRRRTVSYRAIVLAVTLCGASGAAFGPSSTTAPSLRPVYGRVIDAGTGKPIESVPVIASGAQIGTVTKANGTFVLSNVPGDLTRIEFRHPCYFRVQVTIPENRDVEVEIGLPFDQSSLQRAGCGGLGARKKG